ncbi:MAG: hypothetical protein QOK37_1860 [Thermoanaerobaculia bacterium]|jgi:hypothetical protein|nr:hypothetical protein [Thermoanaerobaculia bacterium]
MVARGACYDPATMKKHLAAIVFVAGCLLLIADRVAWASVSQWREDQALSMWLGSHFFSQPTPVGLLNSVGIPNPNGIAIVGLLLSPLPGLFAVSIFLGCVSAAAAFVVVVPERKELRRMWPALVVLWSSIHLRGLGVELWGQWLMIPMDLLFIAASVAYLRRPRLVHWGIVGVLIFAAPAIYLAGLVNAVVFAMVWIAVVLYAKLRLRREVTFRWFHVAATLLPIAVTAFFVTWLPYLRVVSMQGVVHRVGLPFGQRLKESFLALVTMPAALGDLLRCGLAPLLQADDIVRPAAFALAALSGLAASIQVIVLAVAAVLVIKRKHANGSGLEASVIAALLIVLSFPLSPLLGGFLWHRGERLDQSIQFLPLLLLILFSVPLSIDHAMVRRTTIVLVVLFGVTSTMAGLIVVNDHLQYRGPILSQADVPLIQKTAAVRWIANDWRARSHSRPVPVAYELVGIWRFLPAYGKLVSRWYPGQMSIGRAFDYELLRQYGLANAYEGLVDRPNQQARYVVSYAFMPPPSYVSANASEHLFGRLRVSVQERR